MTSKKRIVGIDLGTTNTVVAALKDGAIGAVPLTQHVGPGEVSHAKKQLPSVIYVPAEGEFPDDATTLPWGKASAPFTDDTFVGEFAAVQGAKVPGRLVASSKSWLCHPAVDRRRAFLPWGADDDVQKMSPVQAATRVLAHVKHALADVDHAKLDDDAEVVLTVPASFDEVARSLTVQAAQDAGLPPVHVIEEPQAAFYDFLHQHDDDVKGALQQARLVLIVDVGGGTCDLTLMKIDDDGGELPRVERIAVSDHLMLGGDNMDATLARHVEQALTGSSGNLEAARWGALLTGCRLAKEVLTDDDAPDEIAVTLPSRGRKLIGGAKSYTLKREEALELLVDGFFPLSDGDRVPEKRARTALAEFSLPFVADPAVPHHICAFLRAHVGACEAIGVDVNDGLPRPDAVLFNGGVFNAPAIQKRMQDVFAHWFGEAPLTLAHRSLDVSVARGAVVSALAKQGKGVRIEGGSARSYFVGIDDGSTEKALCIVEKGMAEGTTQEVSRTFHMRVGEPVTFSLYHTSQSDKTEAGAVVDVDDKLTKLPPLETVLKLPPELPVQLKSTLTELGTLEISLEMTPEALQQFALSFSTRHEEAAETAGDKDDVVVEKPHKELEKAKDEISLFYGNKGQDVDPRQVKVLRRRLEKLLGPREQWSLGLNRALAGQLISGMKRRRRTADHERTFFQMLGWTLRPGFGVAHDEWRVSEVFPLFEAGVQHIKEKPLWASWWIMWRRLAGGLNREQQSAIFDAMRFHAMPQKMRQQLSSEGKAPKGKAPQALDEMMRALACFERLDVDDKVSLGDWMLDQLGKKAHPSWWPLGRLASRVPFAGAVSDVIPPKDASRFVEHLLKLNWDTADGAAFAAAQIARLTKDRARDLDEELRLRVQSRLQAVDAPAEWQQMVVEKLDLAEAEEVRALGESLPAGLKLR